MATNSLYPYRPHRGIEQLTIAIGNKEQGAVFHTNTAP